METISKQKLVFKIEIPKIPIFVKKFLQFSISIVKCHKTVKLANFRYFQRICSTFLLYFQPFGRGERYKSIGFWCLHLFQSKAVNGQLECQGCCGGK